MAELPTEPEHQRGSRKQHATPGGRQKSHYTAALGGKQPADGGKKLPFRRIVRSENTKMYE
jgi:hypothetical protein